MAIVIGSGIGTLTNQSQWWLLLGILRNNFALSLVWATKKKKKETLPFLRMSSRRMLDLEGSVAAVLVREAESPELLRLGYWGCWHRTLWSLQSKTTSQKPASLGWRWGDLSPENMVWAFGSNFTWIGHNSRLFTHWVSTFPLMFVSLGCFFCYLHHKEP